MHVVSSVNIMKKKKIISYYIEKIVCFLLILIVFAGKGGGDFLILRILKFVAIGFCTYS